jgi:hypothetical protein
MEGFEVQSAAAGFDHHMSKPVDFEKLESLLHCTIHHLQRLPHCNSGTPGHNPGTPNRSSSHLRQSKHASDINQ